MRPIVRLHQKKHKNTKKHLQIYGLNTWSTYPSHSRERSVVGQKKAVCDLPSFGKKTGRSYTATFRGGGMWSTWLFAFLGGALVVAMLWLLLIGCCFLLLLVLSYFLLLFGCCCCCFAVVLVVVVLFLLLLVVVVVFDCCCCCYFVVVLFLLLVCPRAPKGNKTTTLKPLFVCRVFCPFPSFPFLFFSFFLAYSFFLVFSFFLSFFFPSFFPSLLFFFLFLLLLRSEGSRRRKKEGNKKRKKGRTRTRRARRW